MRWILALALLALAAVAPCDERARAADASLESANTVRLTVAASSWRTRGRVSFPVEATLRRKMAAAGFTVVSDPAAPAALTVRVDYRETPGREIAVGSSGVGTDIVCAIAVEHPRDGTLAEVRIAESSAYAGLITAPYVDAILSLETNPYFYYWGDVLRGIAMARIDPGAALIGALDRQQLAAQPVAEAPPNPADTLPAPEILHARKAEERAIDELGRLRDRRAVPLLAALARHPDAGLRLHAITALGALTHTDSRPVLEERAAGDPDAEVRNAAKVALAALPAPEPPTPSALDAPIVPERREARQGALDEDEIDEALTPPSP
jgi:hypothetical protein